MALRLLARNDLLDPKNPLSERHALVLLGGELGPETLPELMAQLRALARWRVKFVALDLSELTRVDPSGVAALITEHERLEAMGGELTILSPCPRVRRSLAVAGAAASLHVRPLISATTPTSLATPATAGRFTCWTCQRGGPNTSEVVALRDDPATETLQQAWRFGLNGWTCPECWTANVVAR